MKKESKIWKWISRTTASMFFVIFLFSTIDILFFNRILPWGYQLSGEIGLSFFWIAVVLFLTSIFTNSDNWGKPIQDQWGNDTH